MSKKLQIGLAIGLGLMVFVIIGLVGVYRAAHHVPEFYEKALSVDPEVQKKSSAELEAHLSTLVSDVQSSRKWHALFTAEQINGWLSIDMVEKHPNLLPKEISDPRIAISPEMATLAIRYQDETLSTVFSLGIEAYLHEPNEVAFRIRKARIGAIPLPLKKVLDEITVACNKMNIELRWAQVDGDPVALVNVSSARDEKNRKMFLDSLELHDGEIYLAGHTEVEENPSASARQETLPLPSQVLPTAEVLETAAGKLQRIKAKGLSVQAGEKISRQ